MPFAQMTPYLLLIISIGLALYFYGRWRSAQQLVQEIQSQNTLALATVGTATWKWDIVGDDHQWSDEMYEVFGLDKKTFTPSYSAFLKQIHPEDRLRVEETVSRALRENNNFEVEYRILTPGADVRILQEHGEVKHEAGKVTEMFGSITDVTEEKRAETELRDRFGMLQSLIDAIPIPFYHKDENGKYKGCNKAFEAFAGVPRDKILGYTIHDFWPEEFAVFQDNKDKALFRQGGLQTYETFMPTGESHPRSVIYHKAVLHKDDGSVVGLIGTILDISERKRMEVALKESEQRFRNIAQSASDWFWEADKTHRFSFLSDRARDILGVRAINVLGRNRQEIADPVDKDSKPEKWQRLEEDLDSHRPFKNFVYVVLTDEGEERYIRENGMPVFDDHGAFKGYQGTGTDITEHVRVEEALRQSEERHRNFAADVAHELRTPLAVLRTHLDNLHDTKEVQSLRQDVDNMSRMVTQLLAATRIETFTPAESLDDVDLRDVCRNVVTMMAPLAIKEHRSIELTGGDSPVFVRGNFGTLEQAVRNLVENAVRYSARGTMITLDVTNKECPTLKVIDRGRGIDLEKREKIFDRFKRADRRGGGAGLGLSIVKRAVQSHNAEIEIEDTFGGGATFIIRFPAKVVKNQAVSESDALFKTTETAS